MLKFFKAFPEQKNVNWDSLSQKGLGKKEAPSSNNKTANVYCRSSVLLKVSKLPAVVPEEKIMEAIGNFKPFQKYKSTGIVFCKG